ncbi:unnamed protein product [Moneuplotes crassus]|uniref:Uncharacterized protein n=1 Tax=Euplotes crassus TaxID=5936 RepID=A0AAD1XR67_EUPCR|nr:unnamed protein product [Moneuplotes crassus]
MEQPHPFLIIVPLMASLHSLWFYTKLYFRKDIPEYYCVIDKVSISELDLTFYYALAYLLWPITLALMLIYPTNHYIGTWLLYGVYDYHGLINLFTILVSLDTYNEFKEFCYTCAFALISNQIYISWVFSCILPETPWIYLILCGVIICLVICVKGMKENIEEEERMIEEMRKAQEGDFPVLDPKRPVIKKKFKEDEDDLDLENDDMAKLMRQIKSNKRLKLNIKQAIGENISEEDKE